MYFYIAAVALHLVVALVVWSGTALLALFTSQRPLAKRLAAAMAGSFPGVLLSQILCAPLVAAMVAASIRLADLHGPPGWAVDALAYASVAVPTVAGLWGFAVGWRTAWAWAAGHAWRRTLTTSLKLGVR